MATFLITGVAGFIGTNIARHLAHGEHRVRGIDNFSTGTRENLVGMDRVDVREADILDLEGLREHVAGVDFVLHQAAIPSVPRSVDDPLRSHLHNATGTLNLLEACRRAKVKRVVLACSSSTYGAVDGDVHVETLTPEPMSPYAVSKQAVEQYAKVYARLYGLETVCLRYFNVYGPFQRASGPYPPVVPMIVECLRAGRPIPIHGSGRQTRDFTHVDDVVDANLLAVSASRVSGEVFNIGCGRSVSVLDLVHLLERVSGMRAASFERTASRPADMRNTLADIDKARRLLGYEPRVSLEAGLSSVLSWYESETRRSTTSASGLLDPLELALEPSL